MQALEAAGEDYSRSPPGRERLDFRPLNFEGQLLVLQTFLGSLKYPTAKTWKAKGLSQPESLPSGRRNHTGSTSVALEQVIDVDLAGI